MIGKFFSSLVTFLLAFGLQTTFAAEQLKVGFVYVSPIGDAGWTFQHDKGRKAVEKKFGSKVKTTFVESVGEGADAERVIRNLASRGNRLVFATSFGYMNPTLKVAKRYPKVVFEHATGYKKAKNVGNYMPRFYEGRYLVGIIAGKMTKTDVIGYVAAFPIPEVIRGINAFTLGIRSVNPKATVKVIWTSSWFDPGKEREAAETLVAQGADILTHHTDSTAVVQTANDRDVYAIAYHSNMSKHGKKAHLAAVVHNWEKFYIKRVQEVMDGKWKSRSVWGGIKDGMISLEGVSSAVPSSLLSLVNKKKAAIVAGGFHPFQGPFKKQSGKSVVAKGKKLSDSDMLSMNYYVEGVQGSLPK